MATPTLTVTTDFGTFTRQTARTYTHIVIVRGYRAEHIEANRLATIAGAKKAVAKYQRTIDTGVDPDTRQGASGDWDRKMTTQYLAEGRYQGWIADEQQSIARLEAIGPITQDLESWSTDERNLTSTPTWAVFGWCGRLDLARNLAATKQATRYREVHIIDVATGKVVA